MDIHPERTKAEARILNDYDNIELRAAYADWLIDRGDLRGELIALQIGCETRDAEKYAPMVTSFMKEHSAALFGRLGPDGDLHRYIDAALIYGFWDRLKVFVDYDTAESFPSDVPGIPAVLEHVFNSDASRLLRTLQLGLTEGVVNGEASWQESMNVVAQAVRPTIRELHVGCFTRGDDTEVSWTTIGSLAELWSKLPNLERLTVHGGSIQLGKIIAPRLKILKIQTGGLLREPIQQIFDARAELKQLEELELWFGSSNYGVEASLEDAVRLIGLTPPLRLKRLGLMNAEFIDELCSVLADAAWIKHIEELDISMGMLTARGAEALISRADAFQHLKKINVDQSFLNEDALRALRAALPQVVGDQQQQDNEYLYVSVGE